MNESSTVDAINSASSSAISEDELALVHALQVQPRATWTDLADVLGCTTVTASRRWQRLHEEGIAWVTAVPGARCAAFTAFVRLRCAAGHREAVAARLAQDPEAVTIELTAGSFDLFVEVITADLAAFTQYLLARVEKLPGVTQASVAVATHVVTEASRWRLDALEPRASSALADAAHPRTTRSSERPTARQLSELDLRLLTALGADGRQPWDRLAGTTGTSAATARRRVERLLATEEAALRCDIAAPLFGRPVTLSLHAQVPASDLAATARSLTALTSVRFVATLAGPDNLLATFWLRSIEEVHRIESELVARHPAVRVTDRALALRAVKRMGHLLAPSGRSTASVPLGPWAGQNPLN
ncbi:DNA-binding Lrp family transcriptional regulator [Streptacidiphilus sp. BW17]|uniref:Lrp/AsnC family transcriptional regulator n=1 Tax=Streptacidiphilus sp. BW17 TaxID=3156274 RepID=UPI0035146CA9